MTTRRYVSGPCIALLRDCHRVSVNEKMGAGLYGPRFRVGKIDYVALAAVERAEGCKFSEEQLDLASAGLPDRIITIKEDTAHGT